MMIRFLSSSFEIIKLGFSGPILEELGIFDFSKLVNSKGYYYWGWLNLSFISLRYLVKKGLRSLFACGLLRSAVLNISERPFELLPVLKLLRKLTCSFSSISSFIWLIFWSKICQFSLMFFSEENLNSLRIYTCKAILRGRIFHQNPLLSTEGLR